MPKINWNDFNDSDSSLSSQGEAEQQMTIFKKSAKISESRLKTACDQMSLIKLSKHDRRQVWLYIPNSFYDKYEEVDQLLRDNQQLKKATRIKTIGWNVLVDKQLGKTLICEGIESKDIFVKFIYSNKNEDNKIQHQEQRNSKLQKRVTYVEKNTKDYFIDKQKQQEKSVETTEINKIQISRLNSQKSPANKANKNTKWIEKPKSLNIDEFNGSFNTYDELKSPKQIGSNKFVQPMNKQAVESNKNYRDLKQIKSPKKYVLKDETILKKDTQSQNNLESKQKHITDTILEKNEAVEEKLEKDIKKQQIQNKNEQKQAQSENESSDSLQKQLKKKKKKKKKAKTMKSQKIDNNPFSSLVKH